MKGNTEEEENVEGSQEQVKYIFHIRFGLENLINTYSRLKTHVVVR